MSLKKGRISADRRDGGRGGGSAQAHVLPSSTTAPRHLCALVEAVPEPQGLHRSHACEIARAVGEPDGGPAVLRAQPYGACRPVPTLRRRRSLAALLAACGRFGRALGRRACRPAPPTWVGRSSAGGGAAPRRLRPCCRPVVAPAPALPNRAGPTAGARSSRHADACRQLLELRLGRGPCAPGRPWRGRRGKLY